MKPVVRQRLLALGASEDEVNEILAQTWASMIPDGTAKSPLST